MILTRIGKIEVTQRFGD